MNEKDDSGGTRVAGLRSKAEESLRTGRAGPATAVSEADARALVHELQVHQIELEMQNEELQRAQAEAQEASEKYYDLFDFAPVGYFLWDHEGRILEVNLAGAALLGLDRRRRGPKAVRAIRGRGRPSRLCRFLQTGADDRHQADLRGQALRDGQAVDVLVEGIAAQDRQGQGETLPCGGHRHHPAEARGRVGGGQPGPASRDRLAPAGGGGAAARARNGFAS